MLYLRLGVSAARVVRKGQSDMPPPPSSRSSGSQTSRSRSSAASVSTPASRGVGGSNRGGANTGPRSSGPPSRGSRPATSGQRADQKNIQSSAVRDANKIARESTALREDAKRSGIRSINIGPAQQPVNIGSGRVSKAATTSDYESFYASDPYYRDALQKRRADAELSRSSVAKADATRYSREAPAYNFITDAERSSLSPSGIAGRLAGGIYDLASYAYNNPAQAAGNVARAIAEPFVTGGQYLMGAKPMYDRQGNILPQAADDLTGVAMGTAIGANVAGFAAPRPVNSLGMFVGPNALPVTRRAYEYGKKLSERGASAEDVFHATAARTPYGVSGLQNIPGSENWGFEVSAPMKINEEAFLTRNPITASGNILFGRMLPGEKPLSQVSDLGPLSGAYKGDFAKTPVSQVYRPGSDIDFYTKSGREFSGLYSPRYGEIGMNVPFNKGLMPSYTYAPDEFRRTLAHEAQHRIADLDRTFVPPGYSPQSLRNIYEDSNVYVPERDLEEMARKAYMGSRGEILSRLTESRLDKPAGEMKDWSTRITAPSKEWDRAPISDEVIKQAEEYVKRELQRRRARSGWNKITLD